MKRLIKKSEIFNGSMLDEEYYECYKNPTVKEYNEIFENETGVRGIITEDGEIYIWSIYILHSTAIGKFDIPEDGIHFDIVSKTLTIHLIPEINIENFKNIMNSIKNKFDSYGIGPATIVDQINTDYYGAKSDPQYSKVKTLSDIYNLNIGEAITAELSDAANIDGKYYEFFVNPTSREVREIKKNGNVRGIIDKNSDIYVWNGELLHDKALNYTGLPDGIHFDVGGSGIYLYLIAEVDINYFKNAITGAMDKLKILNVSPNTPVLEINIRYYGAEYYPEYDNITNMKDILELNINSIKTGELYNSIKKSDEYIEIFKNPVANEFNEIINVSQHNSVRGIIQKNGDIYLWNGDYSHNEIMNIGNIPDGIHFQYEKKLYIYIVSGYGIEDVKEAFNNARSKLESFGFVPDTILGWFDITTYNAKYYPEHDNIMLLKDIYNLNIEEKGVKTAEIYNGFNMSQEYIEVFKNPTIDEFTEIISASDFGSVRGTIQKNGDIYAWRGDYSHNEAIHAGNIPDGIHFDYDKKLYIYIIPGFSKEDVQETFANAKSKLESFGFTSHTILGCFDTDTYNAMHYKEYDSITLLRDIYNLNIQEKSAKTAELFDAYTSNGDYIEVFKNPTSQEIEEVKKRR